MIVMLAASPATALVLSSLLVDEGPMKRQSMYLASALFTVLIFAGGPARAQQAVRVEKDLLGEKPVPADACYGVQTARALENFQISGETTQRHPELVEGLALTKMAAARANYDVGAMKKNVRDAIDAAGKAILAGRYHETVRRGPLPRRRRHIDKHECERGHGQRRSRADRA